MQSSLYHTLGFFDAVENQSSKRFVPWFPHVNIVAMMAVPGTRFVSETPQAVSATTSNVWMTLVNTTYLAASNTSTIVVCVRSDSSDVIA